MDETVKVFSGESGKVRIRREREISTLTFLVDLMYSYEAYLAGECRSPEGRRRYVWALKRAWKWWDERLGRPAINADLHFASVQEYKEYLGVQGASGSTIINALAAIKDFSRFAIIKGLRSDDPTAGVRRPPKRRPAPSPLYQADISALLRALTPRARQGTQTAFVEQRNRVIILFFLFTGLRVREVAQLRRKHLRLRDGVVEVRRGKNDKDRMVDLHDDIIAELQAFLPPGHPDDSVFLTYAGRPLSYKGIQRVFDTWLPPRFENDRVHVHPHKLRHTFACMLLWEEQQLNVIQKLLGHAQLSTTEYYLRVERRQTRAAITRLPGLDTYE